MISHLTGTLRFRDLGSVIIDVAGVGYKIYVSADALKRLSDAAEGDTISVWTHLAVRETSHELYGFATKEELDFFELLIGISGIGPKSALAILSMATVETIKRAVAAGDTSYLTKVSGIGKKSAERIVIELRDKLGEDGEGTMLKDETEAVEALKALGYGVKESREAIKNLNGKASGTEELVKAALKDLGGNGI